MFGLTYFSLGTLILALNFNINCPVGYERIYTQTMFKEVQIF